MAALVIAVFAPALVDAIEPAAARAAGAVDAAQLEEAFWAVLVNGRQPPEVVLLLQDKDGRLLARRADLERWRLRLSDEAPVVHAGERFHPLDALHGLSYRADQASQTLTIEAGPGLFDSTSLTGKPPGFTTPTPSPPGGFLNYDLFVDHGQNETHGSGLVELGAFNRWGTGVSSVLGRDAPGIGKRLVRLETTWTSDQPGRLASLRFGDSISSAGTWGRPVRFGGIQWGTNFATQPGFIAFPLPGLSGEAVLPSTVDLYIDDALRMRREVPTGPFSIQDLPIVTGQGEARIVVRDVLGREQVITRPYYGSPRLLQEGLHDYSYEVGFVRRNFGIVSNDYGRALAVGTHRVGLSDRFTGEIRGEVLRDQQTAGVGGALLWPEVGVFTSSLAGSRRGGASGGLVGLGFERQSREFSIGATIQLASERFAQLGLQPGERSPRMLGQAFGSVSLGAAGSIGVTYTRQAYRDRDEVALAGLGYSVSLGKLGFLSISALRFLSGTRSTSFGVNFSRPLGERTSASVGATSQGGVRQEQLQLQQNVPAGSGFGYRLVAGAGDVSRREVGVIAQSDFGTYTLEAAQFDRQTAFRGSASGGVALLGGGAYLSRRIDDAFAVVQVPDYPGVRIYADNQVVGRTGADGTALLPRLRPYQENPIRIEQADLPLDAQIDADRLETVPYFRSGLVLRFPIRRSRGAVLTVLLDDGQPLPAGAVAQIVGDAELFPSGQRGELYLSGLAANNRVRISWRERSCEIALSFPETVDPLPNLGTFTCAGVVP